MAQNVAWPIKVHSFWVYQNSRINLHEAISKYQ